MTDGRYVRHRWDLRRLQELVCRIQTNRWSVEQLVNHVIQHCPQSNLAMSPDVLSKGACKALLDLFQRGALDQPHLVVLLTHLMCWRLESGTRVCGELERHQIRDQANHNGAVLRELLSTSMPNPIRAYKRTDLTTKEGRYQLILACRHGDVRVWYDVCSTILDTLNQPEAVCFCAVARYAALCGLSVPDHVLIQELVYYGNELAAADGLLEVEKTLLDKWTHWTYKKLRRTPQQEEDRQERLMNKMERRLLHGNDGDDVGSDEDYDDDEQRYPDSPDDSHTASGDDEEQHASEEPTTKSPSNEPDEAWLDWNDEDEEGESKDHMDGDKDKDQDGDESNHDLDNTTMVGLRVKRSDSFAKADIDQPPPKRRTSC